MLAEVPGLLQLGRSAVILQEDGCQVTEALVGREREAEHALHHGQRRGLRARPRRRQEHQRGHGRHHGLLVGAGQAVDDGLHPVGLQDVLFVCFIQAQVAKTTWKGERKVSEVMQIHCSFCF